MSFPAGQAFRIGVVSGIVALVSLYSLLTAAAQPAPGQPVAPASAAAELTAKQVERLVASIALYPDLLVAQILMAATYPLEVVEADRWLQVRANAALKGDALTVALQKEPWDPSIKSLVAFPQVLHMMDSNLDWTEQVGDAFLAQQADVMDAIQRLRQRAQAAGALASTPQQTVATEDQEIMIEPANPEIVYVPVYNPWCVYGAWPYPDYPPFYFDPWSGYCVPADYLLAFGVGFYPFGFWDWGRFEWRHHIIRVDHDRFERFHTGHEPAGGIWQHDPAHRHGVPYRDPATAARFNPAGTARGFRGFAPTPATTPLVKPAVPSVGRGPAAIGRPAPSLTVPQRTVPPAFQSFGRGSQVRGESERGFSSRMTSPAAPMPSFHSGGAGGGLGSGGGFHGGGAGGGLGGGGGFHGGGGGGGGFHGGGGGGLAL
jgi:uncharacterized membrane protein YgcG